MGREQIPPEGRTKAKVSENSAADCSDEGLLSTGDMAKYCNTTLRTVRFYENEGLIEASRNCGGHRVFDKQAADKLQLIIDFREAGLAVADIRKLLSLKQAAGCPQSATKEMDSFLNEQQDVLTKKIEVLERLRTELATMQSVVIGCATCETPSFPSDCKDCEKMQCSKLPRALRVLWKTCQK